VNHCKKLADENEQLMRDWFCQALTAVRQDDLDNCLRKIHDLAHERRLALRFAGAHAAKMPIGEALAYALESPSEGEAP